MALKKIMVRLDGVLLAELAIAPAAALAAGDATVMLLRAVEAFDGGPASPVASHV